MQVCATCQDSQYTLIYNLRDWQNQPLLDALEKRIPNWEGLPCKCKKTEDGIWELSIPILPEGHYQYRFIINGETWKSDPINFYRMPDGMNV